MKKDKNIKSYTMKALLSILDPKGKGISPGCKRSLRPMSMPTGHTPSKRSNKIRPANRGFDYLRQ